MMLEFSCRRRPSRPELFAMDAKNQTIALAGSEIRRRSAKRIFIRSVN
jgi:hypothetical protein